MVSTFSRPSHVISPGHWWWKDIMANTRKKRKISGSIYLLLSEKSTKKPWTCWVYLPEHWCSGHAGSVMRQRPYIEWLGWPDPTSAFRGHCPHGPGRSSSRRTQSTAIATQIWSFSQLSGIFPLCHCTWSHSRQHQDILEGPGIKLSLVKHSEKCQILQDFDREVVKKFPKLRKISCHGRYRQNHDCVQTVTDTDQDHLGDGHPDDQPGHVHGEPHPWYIQPGHVTYVAICDTVLVRVH